MEVLKALHAWISTHLTKLLGLAQGLIAAAAAVDGIIPPKQLKYYMFALGVLTFLRGWWNSTQPSSPPSE